MTYKGIWRSGRSTLRRRVNQRDWPAAAKELRRWIYGGGRVLPGLVASLETGTTSDLLVVTLLQRALQRLLVLSLSATLNNKIDAAADRRGTRGHAGTQCSGELDISQAAGRLSRRCIGAQLVAKAGCAEDLYCSAIG